MTNFIVEVQNLEGTEFIQGVTITINWDFFGSNQKIEGITDSKGIANFNINVYNTSLQVVASKNGNIDKETVQVDLFGIAHPDKVTMNLAFKPFEQGQDTLDNIANEIKQNTRNIVIVVTVVGTLFVAVWLINKAKYGDISAPKIPNLKIKEKFNKE